MAINSINGNTVLTTGFFPPCRAATTGSNIVLSGLQTIDGVSLLAGDRVLVKDQADATTNGIYAAATGNWVRTTDAQSNTQFFDGMAVLAASGTINAGTPFMCTCTDDPVVIGTSLLTFASLSSVANALQSATSATSLAIGLGAKTFAIPAGKNFSAGQWLLIYETSNTGNAFLAQVTSYSGGSLVVNAVAVGGTGTHADWSMVLTNSPPAAGLQPPVGFGNVTGPGSSTAGHLAAFADGTGKVLQDGGIFVTGPGAIPKGAPVVFGDTTGNLLVAGGFTFLNVKDPQFGAKGDNSTDDHAAFVAACNASVALGGGIVYVPGGTFRLASQLTVPNGVTLMGAGRLATILSFDSGVNGLFNNTNLAVVNICHLAISAPTATALQLGDSSNSPTQCTIHDVAINSSANGMVIENGSAIKITNCFFFNFSSAAISILAPLNVDGGDCWIRDCYFINTGGLAGTGNCISHISGGGWKIFGCKMLSCQYGYLANLSLAGGVMSSLIIEGNSIEGMAAGCIVILNQSSVSGSLFNIAIVGNQGGSNGGAFIATGASGTRTWIDCLTVSANASRNNSGTNAIAIEGASAFMVGNNAIDESGTPSSAAILIGSHATNGFVAYNAITNYSTKVTNNGTNVTVPAGSNGP